MPLPNLSGKSYISTSPTFDNYQSGADSYREKVKEKIQNSPRQSATYSRSIDLSLTKETQFRPVSRTNNRTNNLDRLKSALNDSSSRLKSGRNRQLIFYNNNGELTTEDTNSMTTNDDLKREDHRKNNTRNRNFIDTSPLVSDDEFSFTNSDEPVQKVAQTKPPQPISRRITNNDYNQNNFNAPATNTPRDTSSLLKAPLITPRKSVLQKQQQQQYSPQQNENNDFLSQYDSTNRSKMKSGLTNRSYDMVTSRTTFRDDDEDDNDIIYQDASSSPPAPPVPVPRKRDQPVYLTNNDEIKIKRNNSASLNKRNMPSSRSDQIMTQIDQQQQQQQQQPPQQRFIKYSNDANNVPIIKSNTGLLNGRKSGLRFRNNNQ